MLKPIRSEADYEANLSRLEALMDAAPGTPEGDELEIPRLAHRALRR